MDKIKLIEKILSKKFISLKDIPKKLYENMELLNKNKGNTSFVFKKNDNEVRIFTTDIHKYNYLTDEFALKLGTKVDILDTKFKKVSDSIYVFDMPMMYPLNSKNKKIASIIVKIINIYKDKYNKYHKINYENLLQNILNDIDEDSLIIKLDNNIKDIVYNIIDDLHNYAYYFNYDLSLDNGIRQFMQDSKGNLIFLDPFVSYKLTSL